jgi:hypothetical protein
LLQAFIETACHIFLEIITSIQLQALNELVAALEV